MSLQGLAQVLAGSLGIAKDKGGAGPVGLSSFTEEERRDFLEIIDDRHKSHSMIITSQIPLENWFDQIGDGTIADAIMDRIVSTSYKLQLKGPSLRPENR